MFIKRVLLLSLICAPASAQMVTPRFTNGSVQSTTNTTIDIDRTVETTIYGGATSKWSGNNITASGDVSDSSTTFTMTTAGDPFQLEITTRAAGMIEESLVTETIEQVSTTTSLSVFSQ